jgi:carbon-monoxide dehydrogenase small subunit
VPLRLATAEAALVGRQPTPETIRAAVGDALADITPMADLNASADYRRRVARSLTVRAIEEACEDAKRNRLAVGWATAPADAHPRGQNRVGAVAHAQEHEKAILPTLRVNNVAHPLDVEPRTTLLDCLRDELGLVGAHAGCEHGVCGACTVLVDGVAVRSCLMFAVQGDGHAITTIEGLTPAPGELSVLQDAFCETHGLQCGYCTPAMILAAHALLAGNPSPTRDEIVEAISGNICRCTGYAQIVEAVALAAERLRGANRFIETVQP